MTTFILNDLVKKLEKSEASIVYPFAYTNGTFKGAVDKELEQVIKKDEKKIDAINAKNNSKSQLEKLQTPLFESQAYLLFKTGIEVALLDAKNPNATFKGPYSQLTISNGMTQDKFLTKSNIWRIRVASTIPDKIAENINSGSIKKDLKPRININISLDPNDTDFITFAQKFDEVTNIYRTAAYKNNWIKKAQNLTNPKENKWSSFLYNNKEKGSYSITMDVDFSKYPEAMKALAGKQKTVILCRDPSKGVIYPLNVTYNEKSEPRFTTLADHVKILQSDSKNPIKYDPIDQYTFTRLFDTLKILSLALTNFKSLEYKNGSFNECKPHCAQMLVEIVGRKTLGGGLDDYVSTFDKDLLKKINDDIDREEAQKSIGFDPSNPIVPDDLDDFNN